jgi:3-dehydrosphinganine reductase
MAVDVPEPVSSCHALITGGSSGIGLAVAKLLVAGGFHVTLLARSSDRLASARSEIIEHLGEYASDSITVHSSDVRDAAAVAEAFDAAVARTGPIHVVVHSAGTATADYFRSLTQERMRDVVDVNLIGTWNVLQETARVFAEAPLDRFGRGRTQSVSGRRDAPQTERWSPGAIRARRVVAPLKRSIARGWRHIVPISSMAGVIPVFGYTAYGMTKFGTAGLARTVRQELMDQWVNVSVLCPPDVDTPQLVQESETKPAETRAISGDGKPLLPEQVAAVLVRRLPKNPAVIVPGLGARFEYTMYRIFPGMVERIVMHRVRSARR